MLLTNDETQVLIVTSLDYLAGNLKVDEYVTHHRKLDNINEGFHDMHVSTSFELRNQRSQRSHPGRRLHSLRCRHVVESESNVAKARRMNCSFQLEVRGSLESTKLSAHRVK